MNNLKKTVMLLSAMALLAACTNGGLTKSQKNTAIGAAIGGVAGNVIGGSTEATLGGAALGGVIGSQIGK